jgi:hypothetical protein
LFSRRAALFRATGSHSVYTPPDDSQRSGLWKCRDVVCSATIDGVLHNLILDLLTTYTHDTELQLIIALSLFPTLYKSFPALSVWTSGCLVTASNNGYSSASGLKTSLNGGSTPTEHFSSQIPVQNSLGCHNFLPYNSSARTTTENTVTISACIVACISVCVYRAVV